MGDASASPAAVPGLQIQTLDDARTIEKLRVLDKVCFPVTYTDKYYEALVTNGFSKISNIALYHDVLVGSITTRLEPTETEGQQRAYIMTLGVLPPYRSLGIATLLLRTVLDYVAATPSIVEVKLHMQVGSPALKLYEKHGFAVTDEVKDYYTGIEPTNDALILLKTVEHKASTGTSGKKAGKA
jgi:ribosomal protein S18 acetylase RimI-like enzyme